MKKRTKVFLSCVASIIVIITVVMIAGFTNRTVETNDSGAKLAKVGFLKTQTTTSEVRAKFNLKKIITGDTGDGHTMNTCAFRGTIEKIEEFESSWTDNDNIARGPYDYTLITVKPDAIYVGSIPSDSITILYVGALSAKKENAIEVKEKKQYVFVNCWIMDETYAAYAKRNDPDIFAHNLILNKADVIIGGVWNSVFPVENGKVFAYHEYFDFDNKIQQNTTVPEQTSENNMLSNDSLQKEQYIVLEENNFKELFLTLYKNTEKLPTESVN